MSQTWSIMFLSIGIAFIISQNVCAHRKAVHAPLFNYREASKWGDIGLLCSTGTEQSPIDIDSIGVSTNRELRLNIFYQITSATLMTNGIVPQLRVKGKSEVIINGKTFKLLNLRWHTPSEHSIDKKKSVAELQQLFASDNGRAGKLEVVIVATLYRVGAPDPIVAAIEPEMAKLAKEMSPIDENKELVEEVPVDKITRGLLNIPTKDLMSYNGSLTTPPCNEGVTWFLTNEQTMTLQQVKLIKDLLNKSNKVNARPIQPDHNRDVEANFL